MMDRAWGHETTYKSFALASPQNISARKHLSAAVSSIVLYVGLGGGQPQTELITTWFSSCWEGFFPVSVRSELGAVWRGQPGESESNCTSDMLLCTLEK